MACPLPVMTSKSALESFMRDRLFDLVPSAIAVIDREFNTIDVCIVVETELVTERYSRHYVRQSKEIWTA